MENRYSPEEIDQARHIKLLDLLGGLTDLRLRSTSKGGEYHGPCPFCGGRDRFMVWPNIPTPTWWCREPGQGNGCGKRGNAIDFVMAYYSLPFGDSVGMLIGKVPSPVFKKPAPQEPVENVTQPLAEATPRIKAALAYASRVYHLAMMKPNGWKGQEYLTRRGIERKTIEDFRIGFATPTILQETMTQEYSDEVKAQLLEAGLLARNEKGELYTPMAWRVVCPVFGWNGEVVQMIGRRLGDKEPRYKTLRGLAKHLYPIGRTDPERPVILTESTIDVLHLWQRGFQAVSPIGKDLSAGMREDLARYPEVILIPQGDPAGQAAAEKWSQQLAKSRVIRVDFQEGEKDLDDIRRKRGISALENLLDAKLPLLGVERPPARREDEGVPKTQTNR